MKKYNIVKESFINKLSVPQRNALMGASGGMLAGTILGGGARAIHNISHGKKWNDNLDRYALAGAGAGAALGAGAGYLHGKNKQMKDQLNATQTKLNKATSDLKNKQSLVDSMKETEKRHVDTINYWTDLAKKNSDIQHNREVVGMLQREKEMLMKMAPTSPWARQRLEKIDDAIKYYGGEYISRA